jgi:hypothetical protein
MFVQSGISGLTFLFHFFLNWRPFFFFHLFCLFGIMLVFFFFSILFWFPSSARCFADKIVHKNLKCVLLFLSMYICFAIFPYDIIESICRTDKFYMQASRWWCCIDADVCKIESFNSCRKKKRGIRKQRYLWVNEVTNYWEMECTFPQLNARKPWWHAQFST